MTSSWCLQSIKWVFINTKGPGLFWPLSWMPQIQYFLSSPPLKLGGLKPNYMRSLCWMREWRFVHGIWVTWSRWLPCSHMVKTFENLLLRSRMADELETWYTSLGTRALLIFFQIVTLGWPWPILLQGQIWSLRLLCGKKAKLWIYVKLL